MTVATNLQINVDRVRHSVASPGREHIAMAGLRSASWTRVRVYADGFPTGVELYADEHGLLEIRLGPAPNVAGTWEPAWRGYLDRERWTAWATSAKEDQS
jgi:hypothetical protein